MTAMKDRHPPSAIHDASVFARPPDPVLSYARPTRRPHRTGGGPQQNADQDFLLKGGWEGRQTLLRGMRVILRWRHQCLDVAAGRSLDRAHGSDDLSCLFLALLLLGAPSSGGIRQPRLQGARFS